MGICVSVMQFQQRGCKQFETGTGAYFFRIMSQDISVSSYCHMCRKQKKNVTKLNKSCITANSQRHEAKKKKGKGSVQSAGRIHKSTIKPDQMASPEFFLKCVPFSEGQNVVQA